MLIFLWANAGPPATSISPTGIASAEAFGAAALEFRLSAEGVPTAEAFGTPLLGTQTAIIAAAIASGETFGRTYLVDLDTLIPAEWVVDARGTVWIVRRRPPDWR